MHRRMNIMRTVREALGATQSEFAVIAGVTQGTVSRWESGVLEPDRQALARIRAEALERGIDWQDAIFFVSPPAPASSQREAV